MSSDRVLEVQDLTKHIELLCSRGASAKDPEFVHFLTVVWPNLTQFITEQTAVAMNRLLQVRWEELELIPESDSEVHEAE